MARLPLPFSPSLPVRPSPLLLSCLLLTSACASQMQRWSYPEPSSLSPSAPPEAPSRRAMDAQSAHAPFVGHWTGTRERLDAPSGERVREPARLDVDWSRDGSALRFTATPGGASTVRIDPPERTMTFQADGEPTRHVFHFTPDADLSVLRQRGHGVLTLLGTEEASGQGVEVRLTLTVDRDLLRLRRETRPPGVGFVFQSEDAFARVR